MPIGATTALLVGGAFSAATQAIGGNLQAKSLQRQGEFNAQIYEQQAEMIKEQKKISEYQFLRQAANARGKIISKTAGKGLLLSGSPLAILIDNESQMQFDQAISNYNSDINLNYAKSGALASRYSGIQQARLSRIEGYSNAFSTMLNTATNYGILNMRVGKL